MSTGQITDQASKRESDILHYIVVNFNKTQYTMETKLLSVAMKIISTLSELELHYTGLKMILIFYVRLSSFSKVASNQDPVEW